MEEKKKSSLNTIAAVFFFILGALELNNGIYVSSLISASFFVIVGIGLLIKRDSIPVPIAAIGFLLLTLLEIYFFILIGHEYITHSGQKFLPPSFLIPRILIVVCYLLCCLIAIPPLSRKIGKKIWFVPGILSAVAQFFWIVSFIATLSYHYYSSTGRFIIYLLCCVLSYILNPAAVFISCFWLTHPDGRAEKNVSGSAVTAGAASFPGLGSKYFCSLLKHVLLLFFTFGIWLLIWIYRVTDYLNCLEGEKRRSPVGNLLLCIFIPFYQIIWTYKSAKRIDRLAASKGLYSNISAFCLIFAIFFGILPPIIMQEKINDVLTAASAPQPAARLDAESVASELEKYKELLDKGLITQEDYDSKKKQILGL